LTSFGGPQLRASLVAAAAWVDAGREELNRINVFPVPDGDTGTNFSLTLKAVAAAVRHLKGAALPVVSRAMAEGCLLGARGNSGMLLSQFLLGFRDAVGDRECVGPAELAQALRAGSDQLANALDEPLEGTILTVARAAAETGEAAAATTRRLDEFMRHVLSGAQAALARTPELLAALRRAGVVDAGGKAFVRALEGIVHALEGRRMRLPWRAAGPEAPSAAAMAQVAPARDYRYCTEVLIRGILLPPAATVRSKLRPLGGSVVVLALGDRLKVHIHTDEPSRVFDLAAGWGTIEAKKADDVRRQHRRLGGPRRRVAVVVDSSCDLPDDVADRYGIAVVPLQLEVAGRTYLDRVEIESEDIYRRMRRGETRFSTSQPSPATFRQAFLEGMDRADEVLALILAGALSGTYASAATVARSTDRSRVVVWDSCTTSLGLGLLAVRAAELAGRGLGAAAIVEALKGLRDRSGVLFTLDTLDYLARSGRIGRAKAFVGDRLGLKPILELNREGRVVPVERVRGREQVKARLLAHLDRRLKGRPQRVRLGVVHAGEPAFAAALGAELTERYAAAECLVAPVTAALGVHIGPGAWGVFYQAG
jgi:DegV family protein with EDD domain